MSHLRPPSVDSNSISARLYGKIVANRVPAFCAFELTLRCNNRCGHCYCNLPADDVAAATRELDTPEACRVIDQIADAGCLGLQLTGGEPLLRSDFADIYQHAKHRGMVIYLFTNGTLVTPAIADLLADLPPFKVDVSLYGITRRTYEAVTGVPGSFERCMGGISLLTERGLQLELKTMVTTANVLELPQLKAYAKSLGVTFRFDAMLVQRLDHSADINLHRLPARDVAELDLADDERVKRLKALLTEFWGFRSDRLYNCDACLRSCHIDPYGQLSVCLLARSSTYDLRRETFGEAWPRFVEESHAKTTANGKCAACDLLAICGQCPGWAQLECADDDTAVQYLCDIAHWRAEGLRDTISALSAPLET